MTVKKKNLSDHDLTNVNPADLKIGIVVSDWNDNITSKLLAGCTKTLQEHGISEDQLTIVHVPGAFELPTGARILDDKYNLDAIICLGCVIEGETKHNEYINHAVATGITQLGIMRSKPFIYGVLTPDTMAQAEDRAGGAHGNKGVEAAAAAIQMTQLKKGLKANKKTIGFS